MKVVTAKLIIKAPIEKVWSVLIGVDQYKNWNPFVTDVQLNTPNLIEGSLMKFQIRFYDGSKSTTKELVTKISPPSQNSGQSADWKYRFDGTLHAINMIRATRIQRLSKLPDGSTSYFSEEVFTGWGAFMVPYKKVQQGFLDQAKALKIICEQPA